MKSAGHQKSKLSLQKIVIFLIYVALIGLLAWYIKHNVTLEELIIKEQRVRKYIAGNIWRSLFLGIGFYSVTSLIPGTPGKSIIFGWLYGMLHGVTIIVTGLTVAGMVYLTVSRYVFRDYIEHHHHKFLNTINRHLKREGAFYLLTLRMAHAPYSVVNIVSGASRVSSWTFCWTTMVGLLPGSAIWAYVGVRLPSLEELARTGSHSLIDPPLITALVFSATLPFLFRQIMRHLGIFKRHGQETEEENEE